MRKKFLKLIIGTALCVGISAAPLSANAASPGDAAALARSLGIPEELIQAGWNRYNQNPELYPPEVIDSYMATLRGMNQTMIDQLLTDSGYAPAAPAAPAETPQETPPQDSQPETPSEPAAEQPSDSGNNGGGNTSTGNDASGGNTGSSGTSGGNSGASGGSTGNSGGSTGNSGNGTGNSTGSGSSSAKPGKNDPITLTLPDGSTFTRVSEKEFSAMTIDEKRDYISTFTKEQQEVIVANLTPDDYKSLLKQLPIDYKAEIIDDMAEVTNQLGLTLSVDELTEENVTLSMKDENGKIVAMSSAKDTVAATGYDRRGLYAAAAALFVVGAAGMAAAAKFAFRKNEE